MPGRIYDWHIKDKEVTSIALHLDNDHAGKAAAWSIEGLLKDKYNVAYEPPLYGKDYNDYLRHLLS